jgi:hypothetical protein
MAQANEAATLTLAELIVDLTGKGIECNFRTEPHGRGLVARFSIDGREIFTRFDRSLIDAYRGTVDAFVVRDLRHSADSLLGPRPAPLPIEPLTGRVAEGLDVYLVLTIPGPEIRVARVVDPAAIETDAIDATVGGGFYLSSIEISFSDPSTYSQLYCAMRRRDPWKLGGRLRTSDGSPLGILGGEAEVRGRFNVVKLLEVDVRTNHYTATLRFKPEA